MTSTTAEIMVERDAADRQRRLATAVKTLRTRAGGSDGARTLLIAGGVLLPLGFILIVLGWYGAAHTVNVYEQIPYSISGGTLGLGLVFAGGFSYFAYWLTQMVYAARRAEAVDEGLGGGREQEVVDAVGRAVGGERLEVEVLALRHPHEDEVQHVHRQHEPVVELLHVEVLERDRVGGHGGDVVVAEPLGRPERRAGAGVVRLLLAGLQQVHEAGAHEHHVARVHLHALRGARLVEVVGGDGVGDRQHVGALGAGDIEQHASADELAHVADAAARRAGVADGRRREAVVDLALEAGVGE